MLDNPLATLDTSDETIAHLERDSSGRLSADSSAYAALKALPYSEVAKKCDALEALYQKWRYPNGEESSRAKFIWRLARTPLSIFRSQVAELALELQRSLAESTSTRIQANIGADFIRANNELRAFRKFLLDHYPEQMDRAESLNEPILEVAKRIMLDRLPPAKVEEARR